MYNITSIGESESLLLLFQNVNTDLMSGMLGNLIIVIIFGISVIAFYASTQQVGKSISAAAFLSFLFSLLLLTIELVSPLTIFITLIGAAIGLAFSWKEM